MNVFELTPATIPAVAHLMCTIKPDWWDYDGAYGQLSNIDETIKTVGWYLGEDIDHPQGWILCRELIGYSTLDLECSGFNDNGSFKLEHKLGELFDVAEKYAREKGYMTFRSGISSVGFNIHGQEIKNIPKAIEELASDRIDYKWYLKNGFRVIGIQSNAYNKGFHLIMLGKEI
ncbi:hypothetical protein [Lacrimispora sp.]|uniref:hypothetical protein n=1 Tax=Lacrimispora sp. TaxID=2719234 RepID=UPI0028972B3B|nr:hypothetical protein [Lacrimispora sp.]